MIDNNTKFFDFFFMTFIYTTVELCRPVLWAGTSGWLCAAFALLV